VQNITNIDVIEFEIDSVFTCMIQTTARNYHNASPGSTSGDIELNISGTPTYFINGLKHTGLLSAGELASLIERER